MDWGERLLAALILSTTLRVITLSFVPVVQEAALARFHLRSSSFFMWAIQAPVPAMYNFRNTWRLEAPDWDQPSMAPAIGGTVNHFPSRILTFGDMRRSLVEERARTLVRLESTYRRRSFSSVWRFKNGPAGSVTLVDRAVQ